MFQIQAPTYTQTPNAFFDDIAKTLKEGELRVLLVIMRQTFGWHKQWDRISLSQLERKTGMCRDAVNNSLKSLIKLCLIEKKKEGSKGQEKCWYQLIVAGSTVNDVLSSDGDESIGDSNISYQSSKETPPSRLKRHTKETITKEKKNPQPPRSEKDGGAFSKAMIRRSLPMLTEEEFSVAWAEYQKAPPNSVKNPKNWLKAVIERIRFENKNAMDAYKRAEAHKQQAEYYESISTDHSLVACSKHVEFIRGSKVKIVEYDMTAEEWTQLTQWIPYGI